MSLLNPWAAIIAACIALPIFIALYILRLRRQRHVIASTFLWREATRDLEVNAPLRRLRVSLLFLVQLLLLATLVAAIGEPAIRGEGDLSARLVLLIDRTASMNAIDAPGEVTRLQHAKQRARDIVSNMAERQTRSMAAILAFGASAEVIQGFSTNASDLLAAIDAIEATDEEADFAAALELAGSFAAPADETDAGPTELVILSDGHVLRDADAERSVVTAGVVRFIQIGPAPGAEAPNIGFVTASARRDPDNPAFCNIFARLVSTFAEPVTTTITMRTTPGGVSDARSLTIPPARDGQPGEATYMFAIEAPEDLIITLAHNQGDALRADDAVSLVVPAPRRPKITIVHAGEAPDPYVLQLFEALEPDELRVLNEAVFAAIPPIDIDAGREFDLIVFDRVTSYSLPAVPSLSFGGVPEGATLHAADADDGQRILSWDRQHPLLHHVSLDTLLFAGVDAIDLPEGAVVLARARTGPIIATLTARNTRHVFVAFALRQSNWPRELSITIFLQNALDYLWLARRSDAGLAVRPGEPVTVRALPGAREITIEGPLEASLEVEPNEPVTLPTLTQAGVYIVTGVQPPMNVIAVNVMSDLESATRTQPSITVNARTMTGSPVVDVAPQPIWTWTLLAALAILVLEWFLFLALKRM